jgi:hypothetical protein
LVRGWIRSVVLALSAYAEAARSARAAEALYERLSRMSDAEHARRGMTRADVSRRVLDRLVCEAPSSRRGQ